MGTERQKSKIILTGGGTAGSVSPLLAIAEDLNRHHAARLDFVFIGTSQGPERHMAAKEGMDYKIIPAGKLRRYFSFKNLLDPFSVMAGLIKSIFIIAAAKPKLIITAGSFVSVPVVWAGWLLRVPIMVHQQDIRPGLANRLMAPFAKVITVTFKKSLFDYGEKAVWTGSPVRRSLEKYASPDSKNYFFPRPSSLPTILVLGGGTGAEGINKLVYDSLSELTHFCRIIHQTGKGKSAAKQSENYIFFEFMDSEHLARAYRAADVVISRCGMGTLTELSYFGKASILIPMPHSHQEDNARVFDESHAAVVLHEKKITGGKLIAEIKDLLSDQTKREKLSGMAKMVIKPGARQEILRIINDIISK